MSPQGHRFAWLNLKSQWEANEPPPDCRCEYCGQRYDEIIATSTGVE